MHEFWHDYVKSKYGENGEFCSMGIDSLIFHVKTDVIDEYIAKDV